MLADCLRVPGTQRLHHVAPQDQTPTQASGPVAFAALPGMDLGETHVVMSHEVLYADACPCPIPLIITPPLLPLRWLSSSANDCCGSESKCTVPSRSFAQPFFQFIAWSADI